MRKFWFSMIVVMIFALSCADLALAKKKYYGGFVGPMANTAMMTVKEVKNLSNDTKVILKGNIVSSLGHEHYVFRDATGTIDVEIENEGWNGLIITPKDEVRIMGAVVKHMFQEPVVEVSDINVVQTSE